MVRWVVGWIAALAATAVVAACDDGGGSSSAAGSYAGGGYGSSCAQYTTCGSCTPVVGCGWCFTATGGQCATSPDECAFSASNAEFTWTWDQSGCPGVDASVVPIIPHDDAGSEPEPSAGDAGAAPEASTTDDAGQASSWAADAQASDAAEEP